MDLEPTDEELLQPYCTSLFIKSNSEDPENINFVDRTPPQSSDDLRAYDSYEYHLLEDKRSTHTDGDKVKHLNQFTFLFINLCNLLILLFEMVIAGYT